MYLSPKFFGLVLTFLAHLITMKSILSIALALAITSLANGADQNITEVEGNFNAARIVPDVLSSADFKVLLDLTFSSSSNGAVTRTGLNLTQPGEFRPRGTQTSHLRTLCSDILLTIFHHARCRGRREFKLYFRSCLRRSRRTDSSEQKLVGGPALHGRWLQGIR